MAGGYARVPLEANMEDDMEDDMSKRLSISASLVSGSVLAIRTVSSLTRSLRNGPKVLCQREHLPANE